jgi:tRNA(fMet)-specific endonuclease VapC
MRVALDTNAYSNMMRGLPRVVAVVQRAGELVIPLPVVAELKAGFAAGSKRNDNLQVLHRLLATAKVRVICPDEATADNYAALYAQLRHAGTPLANNDLWIAALVVQHNLVLCTDDTDFRKLPQVPLC